MTKDELTLKPVLNESQAEVLNSIMNSVQLYAILDYMAATTFEAADQCDGEGRDCLMQQASTVCAAALFCKQWGLL